MSSIRCLSSFEPFATARDVPKQLRQSRMVCLPRKAKFTTTVLKLVMPGQSVSCLCGGAFGAHRSVVAPPFVPGFVQCFWRMLVASLEKISMRTSLRSLTTSTSMVSCSLWTIARPLTVFDSNLSCSLLRAHGWPLDLIHLLEATWRQQERFVQWDHHTHSSTLDASRVQPQGDPWGPLLMSLWVQAGVQTVLQTCEAPESDISIKTYLDDRSCTARNAVKTS